MSRLEITKISLKDVERRRSELDSHRALLLRTHLVRPGSHSFAFFVSPSASVPTAAAGVSAIACRRHYGGRRA